MLRIDKYVGYFFALTMYPGKTTNGPICWLNRHPVMRYRTGYFGPRINQQQGTHIRLLLSRLMDTMSEAVSTRGD
jgi:hypothetical protein